jgi:segregation and condensation protein B
MKGADEMRIIEWKAIVEGLLFAAGDEGLSLKQISSVLEVPEEIAMDIIHDLMDEYKKKERGIELIEIANTYQLATKKEHAPYLKKYAGLSLKDRYKH